LILRKSKEGGKKKKGIREHRKNNRKGIIEESNSKDWFRKDRYAEEDYSGSIVR